MSVLSIETTAGAPLETEPRLPTHAVELLRSQHREVESLFKQLEETSDRAYKTRGHLFEELAQKLSHHARIEEKIFYPEGREVNEDMTLEAYEEHEVMKHLINRIRRTDARDESFMAKITVLKEIVEHHVKEEESEYFPQCERNFSTDELEELGLEMKAHFDKLESQTANRASRKDH